MSYTSATDPGRTVSQLHDLVAEDYKACFSGCRFNTPWFDGTDSNQLPATLISPYV